ncbi:MAG: hypothetical protein KGQ52_08270 [Alphaproteobacteria bacterium]|nr:hypothetical protein [Alphaproteobacteria bacterium]
MIPASGQDGFDLIEVQALRAELNTRILIQNLCILVSALLLLPAAAMMLAWPGQALLVALVQMLVVGVAVLGWCHNGVRQAQIKTYVLHLAARHARDGGWEAWLPGQRSPGLLGNRWFIATKGCLIGVQATALLLALWIAPAADWRLLAALLLLLGCSIGLLISNPKERLPPASR